MLAFKIIACFLLVLNAGSGRYIGVIQVESEKQFCGERGTSYATAENLSSVISSNSTVMICSLKLNLSTVVNIRDIFNITIRGKGNEMSEIDCSSNSGFTFVNTSTIALYSLTLRGCSVLGPEEKNASVFFLNCARVLIAWVTILESHGIGLWFENTTGAVDIDGCSFKSNGQHVSVHFQHVLDPSSYAISNCNFSQAGLGSEFGGGLEVVVNGSRHIQIRIAQAEFEDNNANKGGGGLSIKCSNSLNTTIEVVHSTFVSNRASEGGGLFVDIGSFLETALNMTVAGCRFHGNRATLGGGTKISSTKMNDDHIFIKFANCTWTENVAFYGSAFCAVPNTRHAMLLRGFLPRLEFNEASFERNKVIKYVLPDDSNVSQYVEGIGAFYNIQFELNFTGSLRVVGNNGTAFRLEYCSMFIARSSRIFFSENTGAYGGAVYLLSSRIIAGSYSEVDFLNNMAERTGGAIHYYTSSGLWTNYSDSCCISKEKNGTGISFTFINNTSARNEIDSIRILTLEPCLRHFGINGDGISDSMVFADVGKFSFQPNGSERRHINTEIKFFTINNIEEEVTKFIPGVPKDILIEGITDLKEESMGTFTVRTKPDTDITPFPHAIVSHSSISFYGNTTSKGVVLISTESTRKITLSFQIKLKDCPPGFVLQDNSCVCIINEKQDTQFYQGIDHCDEYEVKAYRTPGIWVRHTVNKNDLESGFCPAGYCSESFSLQLADNDPQQFNICREGREQRLCGACISNYSVYYHSRNYRCGRTDLCYIGWLFYLLTEIVPVTFIFLAIIYSNKSLSSGLANGLVFYAQVLLVLRIGGEDYFRLPDFFHTAVGYISLFYGPFNLDFFVHENLAFCLWEGATPLSLMLVDYLTQVYCLALVLAFVVFLKYSHRLHSMAKHAGVKLPSISGSTIHGITAFLVLTYSQNVIVSMAVLRPGFIFNANNETYQTVVYYMGVSRYGNVHHIPYALTASTSLAFFVVLPTLLLLVYPLHYKVLVFLRLSELKCIKKLISPLEKLKPIFDSFQSTFKDNFRFFSGLFFLHRLTISLTFNINTPATYYILVEVELAVMLIVHAVCQPHKRNIHNVTDTLLLGNLLLINTLSLLHLYRKHYPRYVIPSALVLSSLQMILVYTPLAVAGMVVSKTLFKFLVDWIRKKRDHDPREEDADNGIELEVCDRDRLSASYELSSSF